MNIEAIPSLISSLFLFSLGVVSIASGRKELLWRAFSGFCFMLTIVAWLTFLLSSGISASATEKIREFAGHNFSFVNLHIHMAPVFGFLSVMSAIYYAVALTEMKHTFFMGSKKIVFDMTEGSFRIIFFGKVLKQKLYFFIVLVFTVSLAIFFFKSSNLTSEVLPGLNSEVKVRFGPAYFIVLFVLFAGVLKIFYFLFIAYRNNPNKAYRQFIILNSIAFVICYFPPFDLAVVLPALGYKTQAYATSSFSLAVVIFYIAMLRYQHARVHELTMGLEQKVEERTADLKRAHARMVQSEKMASLGQLVAGVAHEINNPIGAMRSMNQNLGKGLERLNRVLEKAPENLKEEKDLQIALKVITDANSIIDEGSKRVAEIVTQLKTFARLDEAELQEIDIHKGIDDTLSLIHHELKNAVVVTKEYSTLPRLRCFPGQLNQVWLNILVNARQAIKNGNGKIHIKSWREKDKICVSISDNGTGIPEKQIKTIFDPGYTTKGSGVGTGLGLAICYQIIQDHQGEINVSSKQDEGTTFTVCLPIKLDESKFAKKEEPALI